MQAHFTKFHPGDNWVHGKIGKYDFEAKLFDEGSSYGIDNGRVSKLAIYDNVVRYQKKSFHDACIVNYDRGWSIKPSQEDKPFYDAVMELLTNAPKLF